MTNIIFAFLLEQHAYLKQGIFSYFWHLLHKWLSLTYMTPANIWLIDDYRIIMGNWIM